MEHAAHEWQLGRSRFHCVGTDAAGAAIARRLRFSGGWVELAPAPIVWGATLCSFPRCVDDAEVTLDGAPLCVDHADEIVERACVDPDFAAKLPELGE